MKRKRYPKLPITAGKAHQKLSAAILIGDSDLAVWIDRVVEAGQVSGKAEDIEYLKRRLYKVLEPRRVSE